ncbi:amidohydrolase [Anaerostipes sp.]|uniref:amidohydrolase n=1 Tax=Anaerostipes sp. TaxID=1872530 RepID=UPI0025BAB22E|nr:amidohydrolase family protein [Anaerostipes sp.]MBS7009674.1 amidohydrolase family protein [Anaerostipes sp.]
MLIINGRILPMTGKEIEQGYLRTEGRMIKELGCMDQAPEPEKTEEVLDAAGAWVMPGLIDAHCHVGIIEEKRAEAGDDCNEVTDPLTPQIRAIDGVNPMDPAFHDAIQAGITSLMTGPGSANVVGGQSVFMKTHGRCIDQMAILQPAAMKAAFGENPKNEYGGRKQMPSTRMGTAALLRETLFKAKQYEKEKKEGKLEKTDFCMEPWIPVLEKKIPLKTHAHRADDILTAIRIAKEFDIDLTLDHCTEGHLVADEIAASGFPGIIGPDLTARSKIEVQNMSFKTNGILEKAGVVTAIMTDHPVSLIGCLPLCAGLAAKQGMSMEGALKAITINAAKICRADHRVGSLEPGKDADIAVFSDNPVNTLTKTVYTIIDGQVVYREEDDR